VSQGEWFTQELVFVERSSQGWVAVAKGSNTANSGIVAWCPREEKEEEERRKKGREKKEEQGRKPRANL
jgi:hypothetical protein